MQGKAGVAGFVSAIRAASSKGCPNLTISWVSDDADRSSDAYGVVRLRFRRQLDGYKDD